MTDKEKYIKTMPYFLLSFFASASTGATVNITFLIVGLILLLAILAFVVVVFVGQAKVFGKAGKPRWAVIVPFYNGWVTAKVGGKPGWWGIIGSLGVSVRVNESGQGISAGLLTAIAVVGLIALIFRIMIGIGVAKSFGRSTAYGVWALGIFSFIGYISLGFGSAQYLSPGGTTAAQPVVVDPPTEANNSGNSDIPQL